MPSVFTLEGPDLALLGSQLGPCSPYSESGPAGPLCVEPLTGDSGAPAGQALLMVAVGAVAILGAGVAFGLGLRQLGSESVRRRVDH
jgi:hypothetical protein